MSKALSPIEDSRRTLAAQVAERIREAILNRTLTPGSRINQYQMAESLNVSLVPVREALKTLEAEGLVTITPRRGAFVTEISLDDLDELYFARKLLEGEAITLACQHLTDADFNALRQMMDAMKSATQNGDIHLFMQHNRAFHMRIYGATHNRYLLQMIENLWERSELYRYRFMFVLRNADTIHREHEDIFAACRSRDHERARALAQAHIWHTRSGLLQQLQDEFAAPPDTANGKHDR
jgi:DNA-binding GntR family transcriptional regulator